MDAYERQVRELNEEKPVPFGQTVENDSIKLAYYTESAAEMDRLSTSL